MSLITPPATEADRRGRREARGLARTTPTSLRSITRLPDVPGCTPAGGLVVGTTDADWTVEQISVDGTGLLGCSAAQLVGTSLLTRVHTSDHAALVAAHSSALNDRVGIATEVHVGQPGRWTPARLLIAPMTDGWSRLGFAISGRPVSDDSARTTRLEQHLLRIAQELEAAGIGMRSEEGVDLDLLPGVSDLSPRQWDVLRRLLRGERVPGIAKELFLSPSTVRNHLGAIFARVGVHSQEELINRLRTPAR